MKFPPLEELIPVKGRNYTSEDINGWRWDRGEEADWETSDWIYPLNTCIQMVDQVIGDAYGEPRLSRFHAVYLFL